jgi:DNA-binding MarR family transcriptional regulator
MGGSGRATESELRWRRFQTEAMLAFSRVHQLILLRTAQRLDGAEIEAITPARANALIVLFNARRPIQARQLADELGVSEVTVSRMLKKMESDGWIERARDPRDGRAMLVQPTSAARAQFNRLVQVSNAVLDDVFGVLDQEKQRSLAQMVGQVQDGLQACVSPGND